MAGKGPADTRTPNYERRSRNAGLIYADTDIVEDVVEDLIDAIQDKDAVPGILERAGYYVPHDTAKERRTKAFRVIKELDRYNDKQRENT